MRNLATPDRTASRVLGALDSLRALGIEPALCDESYQTIAAAGFDQRTLPQSFVLAQILEAEHPISLRGAFYRAVSAGIYPNTDHKYYRQCGNIVLKLRRSGCVPYSWIADSLRTRTKPSSWSGLEDFGDTVRDAYRRDFWADQLSYVEIVVEKDAMAGVIQPVTNEFDVHLNVVRGNCSESHVWNWAESLRAIAKPIMIYYLGDHDPNGLDIERDLRARLAGFLDREIFEIDPGETVMFSGSVLMCCWQRLAVDAYDFLRDDLIGFPVRPGQSKSWQRRCRDYISEHEDRCVEVDAIPSTEIRDRVREAIEMHIDRAGWERLKAVEELERDSIRQIFQAGGSCLT